MWLLCTKKIYNLTFIFRGKFLWLLDSSSRRAQNMSPELHGFSLLNIQVTDALALAFNCHEKSSGVKGLSHLLCSNPPTDSSCLCLIKIRQAMPLNLEARIQGVHPQTSQTSSGRAKSLCRTIQPNSDCL